MILEGIRRHLRFAQVCLAEIVEIDDEDAVRLQVRQIHLQRGGIHRHQRIHAVARREHVARGEMNLESADARKRARRRANLRREVGQGGKIVAVESNGVGELASGDLHAVTGIAAEANYCLIDHFAFALCGRGGRNNSTRGHDRSNPVYLDEKEVKCVAEASTAADFPSETPPMQKPSTVYLDWILPCPGLFVCEQYHSYDAGNHPDHGSIFAGTACRLLAVSEDSR